ncbi:hypothetical protein LBMAG42_39460 [Deltaproteobacteria bacterium]|nr:hypothetical protein LBMAG42_39460 [Deltaproteobacteria bacterium]
MPQPFVVPEGVVFLIEEDGVTIENLGDVVLHTDFGGRMLKRIVSTEGNIELHSGARAGSLEAAGDVRVDGDLQAEAVSSGGALRVGGSARVAQVRAAAVDVGGNFGGGNHQIGGNVTVARDLEASSLHAGGNVVVGSAAAVGNLHTGGNLEIGGNAELATLHISGSASFGGNVNAGTIRADVVEIGGGNVTARGIQGTTRVTVGAAKLTVDAILAPEVNLDARTSGRVTVVESNNEPGASAIKGGFRLVDYAEMFGSADSFLAERGLSALGAAPASATPVAPRHQPAEETMDPASIEAAEAAERTHEPGAAAAAEPAWEPAVAPPPEPVWEPAVSAPPEAAWEPAVSAPEPAWEPAVSAPEPQAEPEPAQQPAWEPIVVAAPEAAPEPAPEPRVEPVVIAIAAPEPVVEPMAAADPLSAAVEHPMHQQLASTVQRIADCYADTELPPAVDRLRTLVDSRAYPEVRAEITNIWSELLKYHQKKGIRIHHQVTTTFNSVNSLVKKM